MDVKSIDFHCKRLKHNSWNEKKKHCEMLLNLQNVWRKMPNTIISTLFHNKTPWRLKNTAQANLIRTLTSQDSDAKEDN